jgi:hypothetical protein
MAAVIEELAQNGLGQVGSREAGHRHHDDRSDIGLPFSALFTLWLSMMQAVGLAEDASALDVEEMMHTIDHVPPGLKIEATKQRASRRKAFGLSAISTRRSAHRAGCSRSPEHRRIACGHLA